MGHGAGKGADRSSREVMDAADARFVLPDHELQGVHIVGPGEERPLFALGDDLEAVHGHVVIAPLKGGDEAVPGGLDQTGLDAKLLRDGLGDVQFEADELRGVFGVREHVRGAPPSESEPQRSTPRSLMVWTVEVGAASEGAGWKQTKMAMKAIRERNTEADMKNSIIDGRSCQQRFPFRPHSFA